jgi:hypothetical protein
LAVPKILGLKPYQWAFLGGTLLAVLEAGARLKGPQSSVSFLEAPSFLLLMSGMIAASRSIQTRFEALGRNKAAALEDSSYMQERREFQLWSILSTTSLCSLLAVRLGYSPLFALPVLALYPMLLPIINRATGWSKS